MRNETELVNDINTAKQAESIVNHPLYIASMETLKQLTIDKFESLKFDDTLQMQECNIRLNLLEEFEINLTTLIQSGNTAIKTLEDIQTFQQELDNER